MESQAAFRPPAYRDNISWPLSIPASSTHRNKRGARFPSPMAEIPLWSRSPPPCRTL
ncbi:hypothetical protein CCMA1212_003854 [Trichoderma ghanense]|uniref:Uncharacterized protein n=1 Tax=Trichoderma ghanense TaxID=65468 RepID=A0ABY2H8U1_9HYPO